MNCKKCNAEMGEDVKICPVCGENSADIKPEKKRKKWVRKPLGKTGKSVIAAVCCAVLLLGLVAIIINSMGINVFSWKNNVFYKNRYTVSDAAAVRAKDRVIATMGNSELTNGVLQAYYADQVWTFVETYSDNLASLGMDISKPLSEQYVPNTEKTTWEQYFLNLALSTWMQYQTIVDLADAEQYTYSELLSTSMENLPAELENVAQTNEYGSAAEMIKREFGSNCSIDSYMAYHGNYYKSSEYYYYMLEHQELTDAEIEAHFDENAETIKSQYGITKVECPMVDVRHILIIPEGGTTDASGVTTYKKKQWIECQQKAQEILDEWLAGEATEDSFAELANLYSEDPGSNTNGGLYDYVYEGEMVPEFNDWCFDKDRKYGDTGLVQTDYGYHIMYFVYCADEWYRYSKENLKSVRCTDVLAEANERNPLEVSYSKIALGGLEFFG